MEVSFLTPAVPLDFTYNYRVGQYIERYLDAFKDKKILGVKCPACGKVFVPPHMFCGSCNEKLDDFVELSQEGTLENFTVGHITIEKGQVSATESPYILGMIKLDGADSLLLAKVEGVSPGEVETGMRVKAAWKDKVEGNYLDLDHFEPVWRG